MNRRGFVIGAGGALALIGVAGVWRVTRMPQTAHLPWSIDPKPLADNRLDAFRYAILAPNPHNRQPWLIRLEGSDMAALTCNLDRRLPQTDPFDRQITVGFGAFIELARIAAAERGIRIDIIPFPEGDPTPRLDHRPVARLRFVADGSVTRDPLFPQIVNRRTNREPFEQTRPVSDAIAVKIAETDGWMNDQAQLKLIRALTVGAITTEFTTPKAYQETIDLMRIGHTEIDANPDGVDLPGALIEALDVAGQISRAELANPKSRLFDIGLQRVRTAYGSVPAIIWIKTPGNARADQLEAGRRYVRANLRATALGLNAHPMSQSLQEYPEVAAAFVRIHQLLRVGGDERIQMLARIGYGSAGAAAPRWPMESHIIP